MFTSLVKIYNILYFQIISDNRYVCVYVRGDIHIGKAKQVGRHGNGKARVGSSGRRRILTL